MHTTIIVELKAQNRFIFYVKEYKYNAQMHYILCIKYENEILIQQRISIDSKESMQLSINAYRNDYLDNTNELEQINDFMQNYIF